MLFWIVFAAVAAVLIAICIRHMRQTGHRLPMPDQDPFEEEDDDEDDGARKLRG